MKLERILELARTGIEATGAEVKELYELADALDAGRVDIFGNHNLRECDNSVEVKVGL